MDFKLGHYQDLDPILSREEQAYDCDETLECERCGADTANLYTVSNCSPADNYHDTAMVCEVCKDAHRSRCGSCR